MKKLSKLFISLLLICFFNVYAQQKPESLSETQKIQKMEAILDSTVMQALRRANITDEKESKLKAIGVDVRDYYSKNIRGANIEDERCQAVGTYIIFIGKVISIEDMPGPDDFPFHSKVNVKIIDWLKGPKPMSDIIQFYRQSGPITDLCPADYSEDLPDSEKVVHMGPPSNEPGFKIGQTSAFYASKISNDYYLTARFKKTLPEAIKKLPESAYFVRSEHKFEIKNSAVNFLGKNIPLEKFKEEIRQVAKITDQN